MESNQWRIWKCTFQSQSRVMPVGKVTMVRAEVNGALLS